MYNNIGHANPFRYRSYYYDVETGLYYLNSRYYDPELGRFINADDISCLDPETLNGLNLYAYCVNNPVMMFDDEGNLPKWLKWLAVAIGAILVIAAVVILTIGTAGLGAGMFAAIAVGAAKGALIGAAIGTVAGGLIGGAVSGWSLHGILTGMALGFGGGALIGAAIGGAVGGIQFASAAKAWAGGAKAMSKHFLDKGVKMGFKNPVKYTKAAQNIINTGQYITSKNAYAILIKGTQYSYVGVAQGGTQITTFFIKTFTKTAARLAGLIL